MQALADIRQAAKKRVKKLEFGDPITNICAGDNNPRRHAYFEKYETRSSTNRYGIKHTQHFARCTDRNNNFWLTDVVVIYPGHLGYEKCQELFDPLWQAEYGK